MLQGTKITVLAAVLGLALGAAACSGGGSSVSGGGQSASHSASAPVKADTVPQQRSAIEDSMLAAGLVDLSQISPAITLDLRYATRHNFARRNMYGDYCKAYATRATAHSLAAALRSLQTEDPDLGIVIFDAARPLSVQRAMWRCVAGTTGERYVARPFKGGPHNYGVALDLSLTRHGVPLDMGTDFDTFGPLAHIDAEDALVASGRLSAEAVANRRLLRRAMTAAGFMTYRREWWHFERHRVAWARAHERLLDF